MRYKYLVYWWVIKNFFNKCQHDEIGTVAGHLAFISLLAIVPLFVISLSLLAMLPFFQQFMGDIEQFIVLNFLPESSSHIQTYLHQFLDNVQGSSVLSFVALGIIVLSLLKTVDFEINRIFVVRRRRPFKKALPLYLSVVVVGSLVIATSVIISSTIATSRLLDDVKGFSLFLSVVPLLLSSAYFFVLYYYLPMKKIKVKPALIGALFCSVVFELAKWGFNLYLFYVPTYDDLYGSLAILPIFCLWLFLVWNIVLMGAQIVYWLNARPTRKKRFKGPRPYVLSTD